MSKVTCTNCSAENPQNFKYCSSCGHALPTSNTSTSTSQPIEVETKKSEEKKKKRKQLVATAIMVMFVIVGANMPQLLNKFTFNKQLKNIANEINKTCPIVVDQYTRLDNVSVLPNKVLQYNYTLINISKDEVNMDTVDKYIKPTILNSVKTDPSMKYQREHEITLSYHYRDKNGNFVMKYDVTPSMYK